MKPEPFYKNKHIIILLTALGINFMLGEILCYINTGGLLPFNQIPEYLRQGWTIILQTIALFYLVYYTVIFFNNRFAENPNSFTRFLTELLFISLAGFIVEEVFKLLFIKFNVVPESAVTLKPKLRLLQMLSMTFLLVIYALVTTFRIFVYFQQKQLQLVKWQREYAQSQFEGLKNQLNPHFLFNSLSILTSLVYADADKAEVFIEQLSKTYRYLLEQTGKEKVELKQEINFVKGYQFLIEQRFGKKLQIHTNIDTAESEKIVLPHALMIALEYIITNNAMSVSKPLTIELSASNLYLNIIYTYQPKAQIENTSEQKLKAMKNEYFNIAHVPVQILKEGDKGIIRYPLMAVHAN